MARALPSVSSGCLGIVNKLAYTLADSVTNQVILSHTHTKPSHSLLCSESKRKQIKFSVHSRYIRLRIVRLGGFFNIPKDLISSARIMQACRYYLPLCTEMAVNLEEVLLSTYLHDHFLGFYKTHIHGIVYAYALHAVVTPEGFRSRSPAWRS